VNGYDVITIDILGWCLPETLAAAMDVSRLDEPWGAKIREGLGITNRNGGKYLFSHALRYQTLRYMIDEIRGRTKTIPVAICNETPDMWNALSDVLDAQPDRYVCCCGPDSVTGNVLLSPVLHVGKP